MKFVCFIGFTFFCFYTVNCASDVELKDSLMKAAKTNDLKTLKDLLESKKVDLKEKKWRDIEVLHTAASEGSLDVIRYLAENKYIGINKPNVRGFTALSMAAYAGQLESVKLLLELGADINMRNNFYGDTLLHHAAYGGHIEVFRFLLNYFNVDVRNNFGETPAYVAARQGKLDALRFLLENGADPYTRDDYNYTLLHNAVRSKQADVVKELIRYKELIDAATMFNDPPIDMVSTTQVVYDLVEAGANITDNSIWHYNNIRNDDVIIYLMRKSGKLNLPNPTEKRNCSSSLLVIIFSWSNPSYNLIKFILDQGADVNIKNCLGRSALHFMGFQPSNMKTLGIIKLLLDKGADINAQDKYGATVLDYARLYKNKGLVEFLRKAGAATRIGSIDSLFRAAESNDLETFKKILESNKHIINETGKDGMTLLHIAAVRGSLDVIKYLVVEKHFDVNKLLVSKNKETTPLIVAVDADQLESVKLLLELGAGKNIAPNTKGYTLLHQAAKRNGVELIKILLPYFKVDLRNAVGETPAYLAAREGKLDALRFLLENGADPYRRDDDDSTLLHAAVGNKQVDVVRELVRYKKLINFNNTYNLRPIDLVSDMQVVKELVNAGANITDQSIWNYLERKQYDIFKYLVAESGKVNVRITWDNRDCRETLLTDLLSEDNPPYEIIEFMLEQGADVNIKDCSNITALHRAAGRKEENTLQIIKLLLDKGADINAVDSDGRTPLDYATAAGNKDVSDYIKNFGADSRMLKSDK